MGKGRNKDGEKAAPKLRNDSVCKILNGDGYEWQSVFEKAFEGEENLKQIIFDCEAGWGFCYSRDFEILAEYGRLFREMCMKEVRQDAQNKQTEILHN